MATSMELLQQGERFRIIDPPSLPLKAGFSQSPQVLRHRTGRWFGTWMFRGGGI